MAPSSQASLPDRGRDVQGHSCLAIKAIFLKLNPACLASCPAQSPGSSKTNKGTHFPGTSRQSGCTRAGRLPYGNAEKALTELNLLDKEH